MTKLIIQRVIAEECHELGPYNLVYSPLPVRIPLLDKKKLEKFKDCSRELLYVLQLLKPSCM